MYIMPLICTFSDPHEAVGKAAGIFCHHVFYTFDTFIFNPSAFPSAFPQAQTSFFAVTETRRCTDSYSDTTEEESSDWPIPVQL